MKHDARLIEDRHTSCDSEAYHSLSPRKGRAKIIDLFLEFFAGGWLTARHKSHEIHCGWWSRGKVACAVVDMRSVKSTSFSMVRAQLRAGVARPALPQHTGQSVQSLLTSHCQLASQLDPVQDRIRLRCFAGLHLQLLVQLNYKNELYD